MSRREPVRDPRARTRRRKRAPGRPKRSPAPARGYGGIATGRAVGIRQVMELVRQAEAEERAAADPVQAYHVRQRLEQRLSALAERIGETRDLARDGLLALALAGWYASGARHALVRTILRAGGIDPSAPNLALRPRGRRGRT